MNYLALGGPLQSVCRAVFKTTPVNVGIRFEVRAYPKPYPIEMRPPKLVHQALYDRLFTGNVRVASGGVGVSKPGGALGYILI